MDFQNSGDSSYLAFFESFDFCCNLACVKRLFFFRISSASFNISVSMLKSATLTFRFLFSLLRCSFSRRISLIFSSLNSGSSWLIIFMSERATHHTSFSHISRSSASGQAWQANLTPACNSSELRCRISYSASGDNKSDPFVTKTRSPPHLPCPPH